MIRELCYEITKYRLLSDSMKEAYLESVAELNELLASVEGFVKREVFFREEDGHWVEVIAWSGAEEARKAEEMLMAHPICKKGFACIDMATVTLEHYRKVSEAACPAAAQQ
ncbi:hypothetical protein [Gorillibacterium sp. sgz5001074]|uniref:hypothetical protein n=1 Tax=Gorillibacterium sp. sgz5001074 TaxID=3446695 RepID=UPI003F664316